MSSVAIKNAVEIDKMRRGGKLAAQVLDELSRAIKPGVSTLDLDFLAESIIARTGAKPSFKGFHGYPAATCISINDEVVHGIPSDRIIEDGDIVGIDVGVYLEGFHTDTAITVPVGNVEERSKKLINVTKQSLLNGLAKIKAGAYLGDAQEKIQKTIESAGFGVIRDLTGHGVGKELQEAPSIPNYGQKGKGLLLQEGMTLAIEPMASMGDWHVDSLSDGWTVVTADGQPSAHFEHTIVVTKNGFEILTKL
jgi:methionyl aminopeptidase